MFIPPPILPLTRSHIESRLGTQRKAENNIPGEQTGGERHTSRKPSATKEAYKMQSDRDVVHTFNVWNTPSTAIPAQTVRQTPVGVDRTYGALPSLPFEGPRKAPLPPRRSRRLPHGPIDGDSPTLSGPDESILSNSKGLTDTPDDSRVRGLEAAATPPSLTQVRSRWPREFALNLLFGESIESTSSAVEGTDRKAWGEKRSQNHDFETRPRRTSSHMSQHQTAVPVNAHSAPENFGFLTASRLWGSRLRNMANTSVYNEQAARTNQSIEILPPSSLTAKDWATTPGSISLTPTELYKCSSSASRPECGDRLIVENMQDSDTSIPWNKRQGHDQRFWEGSGQVSPTRSACLMETSERKLSSTCDQSHAATRIHLRGGSVLTVSPPELTAWKATIYEHGRIKLQTPVIMPKKNSIASLEAFQEACDRLYQDALAFPRRRSDEAAIDDMCDFFDGFGLAMGDWQGAKRSEWRVDGEQGCSGDDASFARYWTFGGQRVSPVEQALAQVVASKGLEDGSFDQESLRAKGIAHLRGLRTPPAGRLTSCTLCSEAVHTGRNVNQAEHCRRCCRRLKRA